jgi:hypothetical protein
MWMKWAVIVAWIDKFRNTHITVGETEGQTDLGVDMHITLTRILKGQCDDALFMNRLFFYGILFKDFVKTVLGLRVSYIAGNILTS